MVYRMIFNQTAYFGRGAIKEIPGVAKSHGFMYGLQTAMTSIIREKPAKNFRYR